jgi:NAD(P)-dependent dehydrogenase (short-subunit alcohol dehydrogenase family)
MNNLSKLLTVFLTFTLFVGLTFNDQLRSEETEYAPTTLITGANRGIGLEFTKQYLQKGWKVIATCRNPDRADELNNLKKNYPDHLSIMQLDVVDHNRIDELALQLRGTPIDVLLNNAGISGGSGNQIFGTMDDKVYEDVLAVNTIGPMKMAEAFYPHVKGSQLKKIITVSIDPSLLDTVIIFFSWLPLT